MRYSISPYLVSTITLLLILSCGKDFITPQYEKQCIAAGIKIECIHVLNDTAWYATMGKKDNLGQIKKSIDGGNTWDTIYSGNEKINNIFFLNDSIAYACGDNMTFLKSFDYGKTWNEDTVFKKYYWESDQSNITDLFFYNESHGILIGDKDQALGRIYRKFGQENNWDIHRVMNGLSAITGDSSQTMIFGFGAIINYNFHTNSHAFLDIDGDYFTSGTYASNNIIYSCGYNGGIYKSPNNGISWDEIYGSNGMLGKRHHFTDVIFLNENTGYACGEDGLLTMTTDGGSSWDLLDLNSKQSFTSLFVYNGYLLVATKQGDYFKVFIE